MIVRAHVKHGRLVLDVPTDLPEGSEVDLTIVEDVLANEMSPEERAELEASIAAARDEAARGLGIDGHA